MLNKNYKRTNRILMCVEILIYLLISVAIVFIFTI